MVGGTLRGTRNNRMSETGNPPGRDRYLSRSDNGPELSSADRLCGCSNVKVSATVHEDNVNLHDMPVSSQGVAQAMMSSIGRP